MAARRSARHAMAMVAAVAALATGCSLHHPDRVSGAAGPIDSPAGARPVAGGAVATPTASDADPSAAAGSTADPAADPATDVTAARTGTTPTQPTATVPTTSGSVAPPTASAPPTSGPTSAAPDPAAGLAHARSYVASTGFTVVSTTGWDSSHVVNAVVGERTDTPGGHPYRRIFFFGHGNAVGVDSGPLSYQSWIASSTADTVTVHYSLYAPTPDHAAAGYQDVRFRWNGWKVLPIDTLPPATSSTQPSRH